MQMKPDEAAKVLRAHNEWRTDKNVPTSLQMPHPRDITAALKVAVAALEAVDTITERARELIGLHMSEQEGMIQPTAKQFQEAIDALAQAIGALEQSPPSPDSRHPRERVLAQDATRGNFRHPNNGA